MAGKSALSRKNVADQLSAQIESLQEGFQRLSRAATLKDLAGQFLGVVRPIFRTARIDVLYRPVHSAVWQTVVDGGAKGVEHLDGLPRQEVTWTCSVHETSTSLCIVQKLVDTSTIGVVLVQNDRDLEYSELDLVSLRLFVHLFDNAYQELLHRLSEKELIFSLNHRVLQLNSLIDTGIEVSKLSQEASPHRLALVRAASLTNASKGVVRVTKNKVLKEEFFFPNRFPLRSKARNGNRIATSFRFGEDTYAFKLFEKESRRGILPFDETDQLLLDALARQVHASLENRYLHHQALEKQRIEQDIAVAASIQQKILPRSLPAIEGYDVAGINIPSKSVGGDYYDCIPLSDGKFALVIADVAGKGIPAALLVSSFHAYLSAYIESTIPLVELAQRLNQVIFRASTDDKFITAFIALLTPETGEIEILNAGHNPAYLLKTDNSVEALTAGGIPLGMLEMEFPFQVEKFMIEKGERLLLYTDGITEATDERNRFYESRSPLDRFLAHHKPDRATTFIDDLIDDIKRFTGSAPQSDDITALYLFRTP